MQCRAQFIRRLLIALTCSLVFSIGAPKISHAEEELALPQKLSELNPPLSKDPNSFSQDFSALSSSLKLEIIRELKKDENFLPIRNSSKARLNFLELSGYFRTRGDALGGCDLGTYVPSLMRGTSHCSPALSYFASPLTPDAVSPNKWYLSSDFRFRLEPTLNVSEDIRIRGRIDFLDNVVIGSTSSYMTGELNPNPAHPIATLALNQNPPIVGLNNESGPVAIKQLWGEVSFPYGELRFGRLPFGFGLGILYGRGDGLYDDFGNNVDGALFETGIFNHRLTTGFTVSYSGPNGKGGGLGANGDTNARWKIAEGGSRYDLDPFDNVYNFHVIFESDKDESNSIWSYGALGTYRFQIEDTLYTKLSNDSAAQLKQARQERNAHLGLLSLWSFLKSGGFVLEGEAAGIFGLIANGTGLWNDPTTADSIWVYQGGIALESRYGFLQDRLQVGLDAGWASGDPAPGFGIRPGLNKTPAIGAADGQQFGAGDNAITNFIFDRDYRVDLVLFREVLGAISDAFYLKPHIAYYFTEGFGIRADAVGAMSNFASSTPGNNNFLGVEVDGSLFFKTNDGFNMSVQYGHLFPFDGLNLVAVPNGLSRAAQSASALRFLAGIAF